MTHRAAGALLSIFLLAASSGFAAPPRAPYAPEAASGWQAPSLPDLVPADAEARHLWARALAFDATVYGTASVLEYAQLYAQAVDAGGPGYTGFNVFHHERALAGPDYATFKSPNADTLYSNAWLDLTHGPLLLEVPDTHGRYYAVNFLDAYANATNISARTAGTAGGRYLLAPLDWQGRLPPGATLFRVTTPYLWVLLRVLVGAPADLADAAALQDRFTIVPAGTADSAPPSAFPPPDTTTALGFLRILDFVLRNDGHPHGEDALVHRFRALGIGADAPFDPATVDAATRAALDEGFADANRVIRATLRQRTGRSVNGWSFARDVGRYGFNYLLRAALNTLGTGANVRDENGTFVAFTDRAGQPLDGAGGRYRLVLQPPPARFFWSLTLYDAATQQLHPNPINRYLIGDRTRQLVREPDGAIVVRLQAERPPERLAANWLPAPAGRFYLVIRAQGPEPALVEGEWFPAPIERLTDPAGLPPGARR